MEKAPKPPWKPKREPALRAVRRLGKVLNRHQSNESNLHELAPFCKPNAKRMIRYVSYSAENTPKSRKKRMEQISANEKLYRLFMEANEDVESLHQRIRRIVWNSETCSDPEASRIRHRVVNAINAWVLMRAFIQKERARRRKEIPALDAVDQLDKIIERNNKSKHSMIGFANLCKPTTMEMMYFLVDSKHLNSPATLAKWQKIVKNEKLYHRFQKAVWDVELAVEKIQKITSNEEVKSDPTARGIRHWAANALQVWNYKKDKIIELKKSTGKKPAAQKA